MRNLLEYPVTPDEVNSTVQRAYNQYVESMAIGGLDGAIWFAILQTLKDKNVMDKVLDVINPDMIP